MAGNPSRQRRESLPLYAGSARGDDDYLPGNIVEIELHNFMTFNHLKCRPGSRLNLVIGPNGSGKSSLVCAIALGLGGDPQLLGRATSVGAYVKRGEESGYIKISLRGNTIDEQITITRKIDTNNKSEWLFNGKVVPKKDVIAVIQRFNIQVNNLTQFLPQDRVCEFAKLTPIQLLEETEKAVGDPELPLHHHALVEGSRQLKTLVKAVEANRGSLNQLKELNAEQEKDVERILQREELLKKAELMKKKLPWLKYDMKKAEYLEAKELEKDARKKLNEAAKCLKEAMQPIEKQKQEKAEKDTDLKKLRSLMDGNVNKRMQLLENENCIGVQIKSKHNEIEELKSQEESRQERISKAKEDLIVAEQDLANLPPYQPPRGEIEKLNSQIMELDELAKEKRFEKSEKEQLIAENKRMLRQCEDRLTNMENANNKRLEALRNSGAEKIFDAYYWVQEHRHEFKKKVYGPVLVEVNISNRAHADYLEAHVAYYIWKAFITQDPSDRDFLFKNMKAFDVAVINHTGGDCQNRESFRPSHQMSELGIYSRLDQVFDAPHAVKEVLIGQSGLEYSYIGTKDTDQKAEEVQKLGIMDLWTPDNHYRWSRSRYGGHVSASVEQVDRSRLLLCNSDAGELERLRLRKKELEDSIEDLDGSLKSLQSEIRHLEDEAAELQRLREDKVNFVHSEKRKRRELENRVSLKRQKLKSMESEEDVDAVIAKLIGVASKLNSQRFKCAVELKNLLIDAVSHRRSIAQKNMACIEHDVKIKEMETGVKQLEKLALQADAHAEYCKKQVDDHRERLSALKKDAELIAKMSPELEAAFIEMPTTIEELEAAIQDTISEANAILFLNHNVLQEYESRQKKIEELSEKLLSSEKNLKKCSIEIDALKERWLPTLRGLVTKINETFSRNFQEMAVAAEVSLDEHDVDFDQYGILIKVKFRESGQLQTLSAHHQSGGERSVSTILYLVSLQDLTNCPFRVVDEINQGMDPYNERKMFQQLVRAASQPNTPQCFLLTPKLLPGLEYSEACSILTVMNGPWIEEPSKVWSNGGTWGSVMGIR